MSKLTFLPAPAAAFIDQALEEAVLAGISADADTFFRYAEDVLTPEIFTVHKDIFIQLSTAFASGSPPPPLPPATPPADLDAAVSELVMLAQRRRAAEVVAQFWTDLGSGKPVQDVLETAIEKLTEAQQAVKALAPGQVVNFADLLAAAEADLAEKNQLMATTGRPTAHPSFGPDLPSITEAFGGMQPGVYALGGQPGVGKTFLALTWAHRYITAEKDTAVVWVDVQETRPIHLLALRLACIHNRRNPYCFERALADPAEFAMIARSARAQIDSRFAVVDATQNTTVAHIRGAVRRMMAQTGAKRVMVVVDYIQKLAFTSAGGVYQDLRQRVIQTVAGLTELTKIANGPVVVISSLAKEAYRRDSSGASVADFKEAGEVEYTADVGIQLRWAKDPRNEEKDSAVKAIDFCVVKNRFGPTGNVQIYSVRDEARYTEVDPGDRKLTFTSASGDGDSDAADDNSDDVPF
ncbi:MAG: DnaB-like helicase C-terminal domain-containing protein [Thermacetogeniaceae bacterium]